MIIAFGEWTCHVCHKSRPDDCISMLSYPLKQFEKFGPGTASCNLRYCNDSAQCIETARKIADTGEMPHKFNL